MRVVGDKETSPPTPSHSLPPHGRSLLPSSTHKYTNHPPPVGLHPLPPYFHPPSLPTCRPLPRSATTTESLRKVSLWCMWWVWWGSRWVFVLSLQPTSPPHLSFPPSPRTLHHPSLPMVGPLLVGGGSKGRVIMLWGCGCSLTPSYLTPSSTRRSFIPRSSLFTPSSNHSRSKVLKKKDCG